MYLQLFDNYGIISNLNYVIWKVFPLSLLVLHGRFLPMFFVIQQVFTVSSSIPVHA